MTRLENEASKIVQGEETLGEQSLNFSYQLLLIEANIKKATRPHTFFQLLKYLFQIAASEYPHRLHYEIAKTILLHAKEEKRIDKLARSLLRAFHALNTALPWPSKLVQMMKERNSLGLLDSSYLTIIELPIDDATERQLFSRNECALWNDAYFNVLSSMSMKGKERALAIKELSSDWNPRFWFGDSYSPGRFNLAHSPAFLTLGEILLEQLLEKPIRSTKAKVLRFDVSVEEVAVV